MAHAIRRSSAATRGPAFDLSGFHSAVRRVRAVGADGESPLAIVVVLVQVLALLVVIVGLEPAVTFAFYFGWV